MWLVGALITWRLCFCASPCLNVSKKPRTHLGQVVNHCANTFRQRAQRFSPFLLPCQTWVGVSFDAFQIRIRDKTVQKSGTFRSKWLAFVTPLHKPSLVCSVPSLASFFRQSKAFPNQRLCLWRIVEALTAGCLHTHALVLASGVENNGLQAQGSVQGRNILEAQRPDAALLFSEADLCVHLWRCNDPTTKYTMN